MNISIIIPVWNGKKHLEKNLPQVIKAKQNQKNLIKEVILVEDASTDDSLEFIKENFIEEVNLIAHSRNRGFSFSVNEGVKKAKGDLVCILNQDVMPEKEFLEATHKHFKNNMIFAVSFNEQEYGPSKGKLENGFIVHAPGEKKKRATDTFWASGGSAVFRKSTWLKLNGLDSEVFHPFYWEDVDLSYRALKRGHKILWEPKAKVIHQHESTINETYFKRKRLLLIKERNHLLFNWKNITSSNIMKKHLRGLFKKIVRHPGYLRVVFLAILRLPIIWKRRRIEKNETKVSDEAVLSGN